MFGLKQRRLLVGERYKSKGAGRRSFRERTSQGERRRHAARIVVGARTSLHGIIVRADHNDVVRSFSSSHFRFDILTDLPRHLVGLQVNFISGTGKRRPNIIRRHDEPVVMKDVALADLSSEHLYVGMKFLLQSSLRVCQRRQWTLVTLSRHPDHLASAAMAS